MKIVIDIPEAMYEELKSYYKNITCGLLTTEAIVNGKPLPEGHGRLIDADALKPKIHGTKSIIAVLEAPTIIEADKED